MPRMIRTALLMLWTCSVFFAAGPRAIWLDVPFVKQEREGCGAASIAMVMQFWQHQQGVVAVMNAKAAHIQLVLFSEEASRIYASEAVWYFQQYRYSTFAF